MNSLKTSILEDFEDFDESIEKTDLEKIIKCLKDIDEANPHKEENIYNETINILLLGQTGCGKSTFINSFKNFMLYEDLYRLEVRNSFFMIIAINFSRRQLVKDMKKIEDKKYSKNKRTLKLNNLSDFFEPRQKLLRRSPYFDSV